MSNVNLFYLDLLEPLDVDGSLGVLCELELVPLWLVPLPFDRRDLLQQVVDVLVVDLGEADPHRITDVRSGQTDA